MSIGCSRELIPSRLIRFVMSRKSKTKNNQAERLATSDALAFSWFLCVLRFPFSGKAHSLLCCVETRLMARFTQARRMRSLSENRLGQKRLGRAEENEREEETIQMAR